LPARPLRPLLFSEHGRQLDRGKRLQRSPPRPHRLNPSGHLSQTRLHPPRLTARLRMLPVLRLHRLRPLPRARRAGPQRCWSLSSWSYSSSAQRCRFTTGGKSENFWRRHAAKISRSRRKRKPTPGESARVGEAKLPRADRNPTIFKQRSSKSDLQTTIFKQRFSNLIRRQLLLPAIFISEVRGKRWYATGQTRWVSALSVGLTFPSCTCCEAPRMHDGSSRSRVPFSSICHRPVG
jgi:hypothetical protein